ncbi:Short-chain dehydrogenase/reductase VdtF [Fulvia fulva]|uniref:Short-chain dehydrogenase/reductase VdtF n=1 Tax=Passalora fulva TaxID=5499 RepID=A0A9Q8PH08_PASFU|nr:Short-chain dehydrogenase/reductase VdtF [Fulvia fulva]KAK4613641.1 Short-chain dehydrogenase/reductase VdtF [Fulvia fulva]KAK4614576.1 Short-chain dehydrogenase/reductase VdtF [Fulvia fulva]UJO22264.1 Short-chain dehydrogenase/reductase VdtF [Fulvia fulva]WPV20547.1 Short-chain dehydrogenase/reductase VdtF [Fulvia fulva]WPV35164.1 Short-chain dehydrogenase/reductase VdtF [Fulvia fulva]
MSTDATSKYSAQNLNDVSGLVAVVTGGGGGGTGLGLIIAKTLESNGAKVYITGRRQEKLDEAVKQAEHNNLIPIQGDTNSHADIQRAIDQITSEPGYIDILINNAGQTSFDSTPNARPKPTSDSPVSEIRDYYFNYRPHALWNQVLDTNVASVFTTSIAFLELLDAGNKRRASELPTSQILTIGSVGGLARSTDSFIYNASKAGVHHLMKNLGSFLAPHDIRTNVIAPGWFPSDMTVPVQKAWEHTEGVMPRSLVPGRRMGREEELSATVLYLCGRGGGYCNGNLERGGGWGGKRGVA